MGEEAEKKAKDTIAEERAEMQKKLKDDENQFIEKQTAMEEGQQEKMKLEYADMAVQQKAKEQAEKLKATQDKAESDKEALEDKARRNAAHIEEEAEQKAAAERRRQ